MQKIIITQAILWAAAIITTTLVPPENSWLLLTVLAVVAMGNLQRGGASQCKTK
ncbi:MAG: hypothetical protein HOK75_07145 [Phycisphaerae bacterium]|nr:hypothetical protein [Phycisphaerae bacterium]MBT5410022.1 hypothetical protein [Phycisphaerae bacterium]MBT6165371.1 hypothetical protein [Phycisphaerae bacterium]